VKHILCRKCAGQGIIPNFKHVEDGICFTCSGSRFEEVEDNTTDIIQLIRNERKLNKEIEKEFDLLFIQHKEKMSNNWIHYIRATNNYSLKFTRLNNYLLYVEEKKIRIKDININSDSFFEDYEKLQNELDNKFMIEEE